VGKAILVNVENAATPSVEISSLGAYWLADEFALLTARTKASTCARLHLIVGTLSSEKRMEILAACEQRATA
jgi:hypothetical protein